MLFDSINDEWEMFMKNGLSESNDSSLCIRDNKNIIVKISKSKKNEVIINILDEGDVAVKKTKPKRILILSDNVVNSFSTIDKPFVNKIIGKSFL